MFKRSVIILVILFIFASVGATWIIIKNYNINKINDDKEFIPVEELIHVKKSKSFESWEEITLDSKYVVVASVGELLETATVKDAEGWFFPITELEVINSVKGDIQSGTHIRLLQSKYVAEDPIVNKGETVLLFLEKFVGPQTDDPNTYVCNGLFDGHYKIENNKIIESYVVNADINNSKVKDGKLWGIDPKVGVVINRIESIVKTQK